MKAVLNALISVRDQVVPDYQLRLSQSNEKLTNAIVDSGAGDITLSFVDAIDLLNLIKDMKSAVYMLEQNLSASIISMEIMEIANTPAKTGPKKKEEA